MRSMLRLADRSFHIFGIITVVGVVLTVLGVAVGAVWWRPVFSVSHVTALIALVPLGLALIVYAYREAGSLGAMWSRHTKIVVVLAVVAVSVTITLVEFDGNRAVRRISNFTTIGLVLLLIAYYVRWFRSTFGR